MTKKSISIKDKKMNKDKKMKVMIKDGLAAKKKSGREFRRWASQFGCVRELMNWEIVHDIEETYSTIPFSNENNFFQLAFELRDEVSCDQKGREKWYSKLHSVSKYEGIFPFAMIFSSPEHWIIAAIAAIEEESS